MQLLTEEIKTKLPKLRTQDSKDPKDVKIIVKFFDPVGSWTWYAYEGEEQENGDWLFFGLVRGFEVELGYFSLRELETCKEGVRGIKALPIERDMHFGYQHTLEEVTNQRR